MKVPAFLLAGLVLASASAQSTTPAATPPAPKARAASATKSKATGKVVLPDPEILDGSKYEPEKRPLYGMISEIEMGEEEGDQSDRVSPNSGPQGQPSAQGQQTPGGGAQQPPQPQAEQAGGSAEPVAEGPQAAAEGIQAQKLQVPQGAQAAPGGPQGAARNLQIGDASLQIQTVPQSPDMVGAQQPSSSQQYEKKVPAGQQTNNRNQGVEKGKVIPKGL
jgi:hypothetical protein